MHGVKPQPDRGPQRDQPGAPRIVQRVEQLLGRRQWLTRRTIAVRRQCAQAVQEQGSGADQIQLNQQLRVYQTGNEGSDGCEEIDEDAGFLDAPAACLLLRWRVTTVARVDNQRRGVDCDPFPKPWIEPGERPEYPESEHTRRKPEKAGGGKRHYTDAIAGAPPRPILPVLRGAVGASRVVVAMRTIEKARHQQGDAAEQVPRDPEPRHAARRQVSEFVDEHNRPVHGEHCNHGTEKLERVVYRQHRGSRKPRVEAGYRSKEVHPVASGSRNQ